MTTIDRPDVRAAAYQALLDTDSRHVPDVYRWQSPMDQRSLRVPVERYVSAEWQRGETEKVWKKAWQMACRAEEIAEVGDHLNYEIAGMSVIVTRSTPDTIRAFRNVCLHRGRQLKEFDGRAQEFRCAFHGFAWNLDGTIKHVPCKWDFAHTNDEELTLPEVKVGVWGGWVFVNFDPDAEPLEAFLDGLTEQFASWPHDDLFIEAHVGKVLRCNWKVAQEAFMESYHVVATHPQLLPGMGDTISQYDASGNWARALTPNGVTSTHVKWEPTEQEKIDALTDRALDQDPLIVVPEGKGARVHLADVRRDNLSRIIGDKALQLSDAEMNDSMVYAVFPNFHPWGAYNRITYRFRPWGGRPDRCLMEAYIMSPFSGERPAPAPFHFLGEDDDWTDAPELGILARVFNQDVYNLPKVQAGLESGAIKDVIFAEYQETKIRQLNTILTEWMSR